MRIGIDADPIGRNRSGNETYLRGIISGLQGVIGADDTLVLAGSEPAALREFERASTSVLPQPGGTRGEVELGRRLRRAGADVVLAHYNAPVAFGRPVATVIHDVAFVRRPETFPGPLRWRLRFSTWRSCRVSDLIVTVSEFSRRELLDVYPFLKPEGVIVTPDAPRADLFVEPPADRLLEVRKRHSLPEKFVLAVGNLQPRKNIARLSEATAQAGVPLVIVGQPLWRAREVQHGLVGAPLWLGWVDDADLACLYRLCTVFVYPSHYEGFGLPVIEAMAAGAAVVTSSVSALPEVAGDAAILIDPSSTASIMSAIEALWTDTPAREDLIARGRQQARRFTWTASAATLLAALRQLV